MSRNSSPLRNAGKQFSFNEMNTLLALLGNTTVSKIASRLGRTEKAIRRKAEKLGVSVAVVR
jgi:hypothetical protein